MAVYRLFRLDQRDRFIGFWDIASNNDGDAVTRASLLTLPGEQSELWQGRRCVGRVSGPSVGQRQAAQD